MKQFSLTKQNCMDKQGSVIFSLQQLEDGQGPWEISFSLCQWTKQPSYAWLYLIKTLATATTSWIWLYCVLNDKSLMTALYKPWNDYQ